MTHRFPYHYLALLTLLVGGQLIAARPPGMALLRGDGSIELRPAGEEPMGVGKLYLHGPEWQQAHTRDAANHRDEQGDEWRTHAGELIIPDSRDRRANYIQKVTRLPNGLDVDIDLRFRHEARLQACSWALFCETAAMGGKTVWIVDAAGESRAIRLPERHGQMILWQGEAREIKLDGPMPLTIAVDPPRQLVIQDNREYSINTIEFRFNFIRDASVRAGERQAALLKMRFATPTQVVLEEREASSTTDTTGWFAWAMPWDAAPVDLRHLHHQPAGQHGFLGVDGDRFVFEDGTEARFWATNLSGTANFPDKEEAPAIAARMAAYGINLVRIHHADAPWASRSLIDYSRGDSRHFDPENLDRFHFFAAELKKQGVYIYLDQLVHRRFMPGDEVDAAAALPPAGKPYALFDERLIELQKEFARILWTTVNPYVGLAPAQDPHYVFLEYANEHDFFTQTVTLEPYRTRLEMRYREWAREQRLWLSNSPVDFTRPTNEMIRFFINLQIDYYRQMGAFFREEIGLRIPMTGSNWARTTALLYTLREVDFTEAHAYADHPWGDDQRFRNLRTSGERYTIFSNLAFNRLAGKPFLAMEWDQSWPNEWRAELPLLAAAVAALQEWNGIGIYTYRHNLEHVTHVQAPFEAALDPARFGLFPHAALLYLRDVAPARETVTIALDALRAGTTMALAEWDKPEALIVAPELHRLQMQFYDKPADAIDTTTTPPAIIGPGTSLLPAQATSVRSDTGQLWRSWDIGYGTIDTPGTQAVYGRRGMITKVALSDLTVDVETPFATVVVSSLTDAPIAASEKLLLTAIGRAENTGTVYNVFRTRLVDKGSGPMLLEPIRGEITIRTDRTDLRVQALGPRGERLQMLPSTHADGLLRFRIGEPAITMHYLLTAAPAAP